jgi:glycolate oxidase FAD binding subunit
MTSLRTVLQRHLASHLSDPIPGVPEEAVVVAPATLDDAAEVLATASKYSIPVLVWGAGSNQGWGGRVEPALVLSTSRLNSIVDWQPEDLTVVVEAGVRVADLEQTLAGQDQTAVLPEVPGEGTVGGAVAAGLSGFRRLRYGPTRDRLLEVDLVTGDGRRVRGGGRVVKNVTGYDLPRLAGGSFGGIGLIGRVCLKLWPVAAGAATVTLPEPRPDYGYRPLAVIEERARVLVFLAGTPAEVEARAVELGGARSEGWQWPVPPAGVVRCSLRVAPRLLRDAVGVIPVRWEYQALPGVGEIRIGAPVFEPRVFMEVRSWAERHGGSLVIADAPAHVYREVDPWGTPPAGMELQRRVVARFDPDRVVNPGRLAGGL